MPIAICFVITHRRNAGAYFVVFFQISETSKQTTGIMRNKKSVYYSEWSELIK